MELNGSKTESNLRTVFAWAKSGERNKYTYYASKKEGAMFR